VLGQYVGEQTHQQMKEELGLDHFEGRSWQGLHRHTLMTMIAYAFLQHQRLKQAKREKRIQLGPPQPTLPAVRRAIIKALSRKHRSSKGSQGSPLFSNNCSRADSTIPPNVNVESSITPQASYDLNGIDMSGWRTTRLLTPVFAFALSA
jgi:hypothetical protein